MNHQQLRQSVVWGMAVVVSCLGAACENHSTISAASLSRIKSGILRHRALPFAAAVGGFIRRTAAARVEALRARQDDIIAAADATLPEAFYDQARAGLADAISRVDDGTLTRVTTGSTAELLRFLESNPTNLEALLVLRDRPWTFSRGDLSSLLGHLGRAADEEGRPRPSSPRGPPPAPRAGARRPKRSG